MQTGKGTTRRLQVKHEKIWADEVVDLQFRLFVLHGYRSIHDVEPNTDFTLHVIVVHRMLSDLELDDMHSRGTGQRSSYAPSDSSNYGDDSKRLSLPNFSLHPFFTVYAFDDFK